MRGLLLVLVFASLSVALFAQPSIQGFSPVTGSAGTTITISGTGFSATANQNQVFFGTIKATVLTATSTQLTVSVPTGVSFSPLSIIVGGKIAVSTMSFQPVFSGGGNLSDKTLLPFKAYETDALPNDLVVVDLDGDGWSDIATANNYSDGSSFGSLSVFRNAQSSGSPDFYPVQTLGSWSMSYALAAADFDNDGKTDLVNSVIVQGKLLVRRNTSQPGDIKFSFFIELPASGSVYKIVTGDFDGDGFTDIAAINNWEGTISLFRNTSTGPGIIQFAPKKDLPSLFLPVNIAAADFDGDERIDLLVTSQERPEIVLYRNTGTAGTLNFQQSNPIRLNAGEVSFGPSIADFNQDGLLDVAVIVHSNNQNSLRIFRNKSVLGNLNFDEEISFPAGNGTAYSTVTGDINGDGKPDIILGSTGNDKLILFENIGSSAINFEEAGRQTARSPYVVRLGDLNHDGKPEVVSCYFSSDKIEVFQNQSGLPFIRTFSPATAPPGGSVTITGKNLGSVSSLSFGGIPAAQFTTAGTTSINAKVGSGASGQIRLSSPAGSDSISGFIFQGPPVINSFSPDTAFESNTHVIIKGYNFENVREVLFGGTPASNYFIDETDPGTLHAYTGIGSTGALTISTEYGSTSKPGFVYHPRPIINMYSPALAGAGETVTITGQQLETTTAVRFGGINARSFRIIDDNTVHAIVDTGASGLVSIINPFGKSEIEGFVFIPPPVIDSFAPKIAPNGAELLIYGSNFMEVKEIWLDNSMQHNFTLVNQHLIKVTVQNGLSGPVKVVTRGGVAEKNGFTYLDIPSVTGIIPSYGGTGTEVLIVGSQFTPETQVRFGGQVPMRITVLNSDTIKAVVGDGASGVVSVTTIAGEAIGFFRFTSIPTIHTVSPLQGPAGTVIKIKGSNFDTIAANNLVRFGSIPGKVISAAEKQLEVEVPAGIAQDQISVTNTISRKSAFSDFRFTLTFGSGQYEFSDSSFTDIIKIQLDNRPNGIKHADLNGDGLIDLIIWYDNLLYYSIFLNESENGIFRLSQRIDHPTPFELLYLDVEDLDSDGLSDIIISYELNSNGAPSSYGWIRNRTVDPQNLRFEPVLHFSNHYRFKQGYLKAVDVTGDGLLDVVGLCTNCQEPSDAGLFVAVNTSQNGEFTWDPAYYAPFGNVYGLPTAFTVTDLDKTGMPDILVGFWLSSALVGFSSSSGLSCFYSEHSFSGYQGYDVRFPQAASLLTQDQKEILAGPHIMKLIGRQMRIIGSSSSDIKYVQDLTGDGKPDLIGESRNNGAITLMKNNSSNGNLSLGDPYTYSFYGKSLVSADLDKDARPEIIFTDQNENQLRILRNQMGLARPVVPDIQGFTPDSGFQKQIITIRGRNLLKVTEVTVGGLLVSHFKILSDSVIEATLANGNSGFVKVKNKSGSDSIGKFTFIPYPKPEMYSFLPTAASTKDTIVIRGKNFWGTNAVTLGGVPAFSFFVLNDSTLLARPANGENGFVSVFTATGSDSLPGFRHLDKPRIDSFTPTSGPSGTWVTIKGKYLQELISASFWNFGADSMLLDSDTSIRIKASFGQDGKIVLQNKYGYGISYMDFTFTKVPRIWDFTPKRGKKGDFIVITGENFHNLDNVRFGNKAADVFTVNSFNQVTARLGDGGSGAVSVFNVDGTDSLAGFIYDAITSSGNLQVDPNKELVVYPNPAQFFVTVTHPKSPNLTQLLLTDEAGKILKQIPIERMQQKLRIELAGYASGIYHLIWKDNEKSLIRSIRILR
jgi:hypothetical protein